MTQIEYNLTLFYRVVFIHKSSCTISRNISNVTSFEMEGKWSKPFVSHEIVLKCCPFSFIFNFGKEYNHKKLYRVNTLDGQALGHFLKLYVCFPLFFSMSKNVFLASQQINNITYKNATLQSYIKFQKIPV